MDALANYDIGTQVLTFITAKVDSEQLAGRLDGTVSFTEKKPVFDLHLQADRVPFKEAMDYFLKGKTSDQGTLNIELQEPYTLGAGLKGSIDAPIFSAEASVSSGKMSFVPKDARIPKADLSFGMMKVAWESGSSLPVGIFNITDGSIVQEEFGLNASKVNGTLTLREKSIVLDPVNAELTGNTFAGKAMYDIEAQKGEFSITGALEEAEKTPLKKVDDLAVKGTIGARCDGQFSKDKLVFVSDLDLTRAQVDFDWWLRKPAGIGATAKGLTIEIIPKQKMTIQGDATIYGTKLHADFDIVYKDEDWKAQKVTFVIDPLDVDTGGKCIRMPYIASGGAGKNVVIDFKRKDVSRKDNSVHVTGSLDQAEFLAEGLSVPATGKGVQVDVLVDNTPADEKGVVTVSVQEAHIPPLGMRWLLPLRPKDLPVKLAPDGKKKLSTWICNLSAESLEMPPWRGKKFTGVAFNEPTSSGFTQFFGGSGWREDRRQLQRGRSGQCLRIERAVDQHSGFIFNQTHEVSGIAGWDGHRTGSL